MDWLTNKTKERGYTDIHLGKQNLSWNKLGKLHKEEVGTGGTLNGLPHLGSFGGSTPAFIDKNSSVYDKHNNKVAGVHKGKENKENKESAERTQRRKNTLQPVENVMVTQAVLREESRT